jgi:hypothetical protein
MERGQYLLALSVCFWSIAALAQNGPAPIGPFGNNGSGGSGGGGTAGVSSLGNATGDTSLVITGIGTGPYTGAVTAKFNPAASLTITGNWTWNGNIILGTGVLQAPAGGIQVVGSSTGVSQIQSALAGSSNNTVILPADATATLVDTTGTQTLTNKTIAIGSNTLTGVAPLASPTFTGTITGPDSGTWGSGGINGSIIGGTTRAAGSFTTLAANSTANFTGTFQINSNTITWPAAAISVARIDAAQTFNGMQTFQASGATGSNSSIAIVSSTATNASEAIIWTNDTGVATTTNTINNSATANTNLTNVPNSALLSAGGTSLAGLYIGTRANSAPIIFFTAAATTTSKRGQIGGTSGGWCIGNCTTDNGAGTLISTGPITASSGYTVATLPASPGTGAMAYVTDAVACTFLATLTGGGSAFCPVVYNGTAWVGA